MIPSQELRLIDNGNLLYIADPNTSTRTVRVRALEIIGPHENEDSEGVSIFHIERKNQETNCYRRRDGTTLLKFQCVRVGQWVTQCP